MSKRLQILKASLTKKENELNAKINLHFQTVKLANGQPLNDKKNGQATLNKWQKQNESIRNLQKSIEITKGAIEREKSKIKKIEQTNNLIPQEILKLVDDGELTQWRKFPNMFFVKDVEKAHIIWDFKTKKVYNKFYKEIPTKEQKTKFAKIYNNLNEILNN